MAGGRTDGYQGKLKIFHFLPDLVSRIPWTGMWQPHSAAARIHNTKHTKLNKMKTVITALVTLTLMLVSHAKAGEITKLDELKDGVEYKVSWNNGGESFMIKLEGLSAGAAFVKVYNTDGSMSYLNVPNGNEGAALSYDPKGSTKWKLIRNSNGWNLCHPEKGENALSYAKRALRRNNGGGEGNQDQLFSISTP